MPLRTCNVAALSASRLVFLRRMLSSSLLLERLYVHLNKMRAALSAACSSVASGNLPIRQLHLSGRWKDSRDSCERLGKCAGKVILSGLQASCRLWCRA